MPDLDELEEGLARLEASIVSLSDDVAALAEQGFTALEHGDAAEAGRIFATLSERYAVEPFVDERNGVSARFFSDQNCDGFIVTTRLTPAAQQEVTAPRRGASALSGGSRTLQGELEAKDIIHVVMVEQRMNMGWWYDWGTVFGGWKQRLTPNYDILVVLAWSVHRIRADSQLEPVPLVLL